MHSPGGELGIGRGATARPVSDAPARWSAAVARTFANSSGRVIASCRALVSLVFLGALWVDPNEPVRASAVGYGLMFGYLALSVALVVLAWRSWWWDYRLRDPLLGVDVAAFLTAVFFTEGPTGNFTSPFMTFFAFLVLSATIPWEWRSTLRPALGIAVLYLLTGVAMLTLGLDFNAQRFTRRVTYMLVLALILTWAGLQRRGRAIERLIEVAHPEGGEEALMRQALHHALAQTNAEHGLIAWADYEEPGTRLAAEGLRSPGALLGPEQFDPESGFAREVRLFDARRRRLLCARRDKPPQAVVGDIEDPLVELCGIQEGLAIPLMGATGHGELVLCDIDGIGPDHVEIGKLLAQDISAAFDRQAGLALASERALARMRDSLARDLHDTVAQSLAGAALRLEGLRGWIQRGGDPGPELDAMKMALRSEQRHVRTLIERLRQGAMGEGSIEAGAAVRALLPPLEAQWKVSVRHAAHEPIFIPAGLAHEIAQIVREAVANAVRHGGATDVVIGLGADATQLRLSIQDDGCGFAPGETVRPRSISERVEGLGGTLELPPSGEGARLQISLPLGDHR